MAITLDATSRTDLGRGAYVVLSKSLQLLSVRAKMQYQLL